jgi:hypothetical protein
MSVEIAHDDVIGDVTGCDREVAALPEALSPIALADVFELLLDLARGTPISSQTCLMISRTLRRTSPMSTLYRYFGAQTKW